jgi:hypothetical protein
MGCTAGLGLYRLAQRPPSHALLCSEHTGCESAGGTTRHRALDLRFGVPPRPWLRHSKTLNISFLGSQVEAVPVIPSAYPTLKIHLDAVQIWI